MSETLQSNYRGSDQPLVILSCPLNGACGLIGTAAVGQRLFIDRGPELPCRSAVTQHTHSPTYTQTHSYMQICGGGRAQTREHGAADETANVTIQNTFESTNVYTQRSLLSYLHAGDSRGEFSSDLAQTVAWTKRRTD